MGEPEQRPQRGSRDPRPVSDLLILMVAGTVCVSVLLAGIGLWLVELTSPETDTARGFGAIGAVLNTLIGLLAGFLAGKTHGRSS